MTRARLAALLQRHGAILTLLLVCVLATLRYEWFLTPENVFNVLRQNSMRGLVALGMTFVITSGGIDLSVGSLLALGGVIAALLSPYGSVPALTAAVLVPLLVGAGNGLLIARARIQPFITTLATMTAIRGVVFLVTDEQSIRTDAGADLLTWLGRGHLGPVPVPVVVLAVGFLVGGLTLRHTRFGRHVYALGDNEEAARLMGLGVSE